MAAGVPVEEAAPDSHLAARLIALGITHLSEKLSALVPTQASVQLSFNRLLRVAFQGSRVTSDGGLILVRELDERFGLSELIGQHLADSRTGRNRQSPLADPLR